MLLSAVSSLMVGLLLLWVPWSPLWDSANWVLFSVPWLRAVVLSPWFRGGVTGLGLVNLVPACVDVVEIVTSHGRRADP